MLNKIKEWTARNRTQLESTYGDLHRRAEASWHEYNTQTYLCAELERMGIPYRTFPDQTGIVAEWDEGEAGPTIALRADMDALSHEMNDDGRQIIHSCGHDAHMTIVLHAVQCLRQCGFRPRGRLKLLFQPAEETGEGALSFIRNGVIEDVNGMLGIHLRPIQELPLGKASAAIYHGAAAQLRGEIRGVQAHAARPHLGVNVIDSLSAIVQAVNAVKTNPGVPHTANVTQASAGGTINIIPDYAVFGIDLRSQTNDGMDDLIRRVRRGVLSAGTANGAEVTLDVATRTAAAAPNPMMERIVSEAIREMLGEEGWSPPIVTSGGEDFHFYPLERPQLSATMIGLGASLRPGLHHPDMSFDLDALRHGVSIMAAAAVLLFK
ncbi:amidohydrolase [Paenibacillus mesophilus]|uniref:M20 peptidase aminoacylase family protein n=1 Tax=Paenibacillus mesophilus TaxID=2582849 RepID=UPI00110EF09B|nr:M20 peptidase aminoacylase family protein [Paenibacillus mesophilus]TMV49957.1 amidohydrolase [Paenibacillus mesophilus]